MLAQETLFHTLRFTSRCVMNSNWLLTFFKAPIFKVSFVQKCENSLYLSDFNKLCLIYFYLSIYDLSSISACHPSICIDWKVYNICPSLLRTKKEVIHLSLGLSECELLRKRNSIHKEGKLGLNCRTSELPEYQSTFFLISL